jgi:LysM repeat protein
MALSDKYQSLISLAQQGGVSNLNVQEQEGVLRVTGTAPDEQAKQRLWDEYNRIDPDMRSGDLVLDIEVAQGGGAGGGEGETYTVRKGDTLSEIGSRHGVAWREIFEANRDQLDDPDKIMPGQKLRIPKK